MIRRALLGLAAAILVAAGGLCLYLLSSLPQQDGRVSAKGLSAPVRIWRDADAVPTIEAANEFDLAFGLGFAHAQDRLFQMELNRRYGAGRLAEIFGEGALGADRLMHVLGLYRAADADFAHLSPELRRVLEAYSAGVNAFLAARRGALPPEFLLLRFSPEPWRPADTLVWGKLMDLELTGNYRGELVRARLARTVSAEALRFLYSEYPASAATTLAALAPLYDALPVERLLAATPPRVGPHYASNNWVVDGAHSASGKPLLANDPHLRFGAPGFWYLARLKTPAREIAGGTAPGGPLVLIGHNDHIAWGFTTTGSDVEDLFIEKIDPEDPARYLVPGGNAPFETRQETITVRGAAPSTLTVRATRHGPVLSDVLPAGNAADGQVLALATTFLGGDDRTVEALWHSERAADWGEFRAALQDFVAPQQNIVFGDDHGTIGFIAPGRVPIRKSGEGWLPTPGWDGEADWVGTIPFADLPQASGPSSGHFASANNRIVPEEYRYFLSRDWDLPNRFERIEQLLSATPRHSPAASAAIQADTLSLMAQRLLPLMTRMTLPRGPAREAVGRLQRWDFRMDMDRVEPLLFTAWLRAFARDVFYTRLGETAADYWDLRPQVIEAILTSHPEWCADPHRPEATNCETRLAAALNQALDELGRAYGPEMVRWQWRRAHIAHFDNPVFSRIQKLREWLDVALPTSGGYDTLNRGPSTIHDDAHPFEQRFGAGFRIITDLADPQGARMIAAPGQSGNPLSPHYADLVLRWRDFEWLVPGRARPVALLTLEPAR